MSTTERELAKPTYTLEEAAAVVANVLPLVTWTEVSPLKAPRGNRVCLEASIQVGRGKVCGHMETVMIDDRVRWLGDYALGRARYRMVRWLLVAAQ